MNVIVPQLRRSALLAASLLVASPAALAQSGGRFTARAELGGTLPVSAPQSDAFGLGLAVRGDVGVRVAGPLYLRASASYLRWPASDASQSDARSAAAALLGGGVSLEPEVTARVRLRVEADLGVAFNGTNGDPRLAWSGGVGAWIGLGDHLDLGPILRLGAIQPATEETLANGGPGAAHVFQFGLAIAFHDAPPVASTEPVPTEPPAPPAPPVVVAPPVVTAPPPAAPIVSIGIPTDGAPAGAVADAPGAAAAAADEGPRGRHGRRHRRGRHGGGGGRHRRQR
jgi:hypothetical protein